jgi:hypothetical protein
LPPPAIEDEEEETKTPPQRRRTIRTIQKYYRTTATLSTTKQDYQTRILESIEHIHRNLEQHFRLS